MWLKLGTRGDPRVIYVIIIGLILFGLHRGYYSLYNLNNGQENLKVIGQEIKKINYFDSHVKLQARTLDKHIGGGREIIDTLYYDLPADRNDIYNKFMENVYKNSWKEENNTNSFKIVSDILGHESIDSTTSYVRVDFELLRSITSPWPGYGGEVHD